MDEYRGSIEVISGLKQKNDVDFPIVEAHAVAVYENEKEIRLDDKLKQLEESSKISDELKTEIIEASKDAVFTDSQFTSLGEDVIGNAENIVTIQGNIDKINQTLENFKGDNEELRITYKEDGSILYLHTGEVVDDTVSGNVISQTIITGGGGGNTATYKLVLNTLDEKTTFSILDGKSATINFDAVLSDIQNPDTPITEENITLYLYVNNNLKATITQRAGVGSIDVTPYLGVGPNSIKLTAAFTETLESTGETLVIKSTKRWSIEVIQMYLESSFNDETVKTNDVAFAYTPYGNLEKTIYFYLDGEEMTRTVTSLTDKTLSVTIPMQSHGSHTFEVWCTGVVGEETIESDHLYYDIMFAESGNDTPIIRAKVKSFTAQQYSDVPVSYNVYVASRLTNSVTIAVNGVVQSTPTVDRSVQTWPYRPTDYGTKTITITCGETVKTLTVEITKFPYEITPVTAGLELDFNPSGRTNQDSDYNIFKNNVEGKESAYDWTLSENFDWVNGGWKTDSEGASYFCVKAGTSVNFNYLLFNDPNTVTGANYTQGNGKEFKIVFKTANVAQADATWLSCLADPTIGNTVGLQMDVHNGYVKSSTDTLEIPYSEEDIIEFDMNIVPITYNTVTKEPDFTVKDIPMIMTYEDGTPAQPKIITNATTSFKQVTAVPITIGSPYCDVHIYRMKAYANFLSDEDILNNFIADARSSTEIVNRFIRNQIYDSITGKLTPESLAEACPDLRVIKIAAPRFTNDKKDKVSNTSIEMIYKNGDPTLDNWTAINCIHNGQGTSSNEYGYSGRNLELSLKAKHNAVITLGDKVTTAKKVSLTRDSVPTDYFNIKVNIASSEHANNALMQKRYDRYLPYTSQAEIRDPNVKNTMNFFNCVVFIKETNEDLSTHQEFNDNEWHFYSIGNIGDSKKTDKTRANDPDDPKEFCVEIMDWNRDLSSFPMDTMVDASRKTEKGEYIWLKKENLGFIYEKNADGSYFLTEDTEINYEKRYYVDVLELDDFSEDFTYGFRYTFDDENPEIIAANKAKWIEFYRFITRDLTTNGVEDQAKIDAWKKEFENWFILDAALYYYLFTLRYTMVDNRAKNSFWHYGKCPDGKYRFDFWDYDNDTALGIDNAGKLEMSYGVEDYDTDGAGSPYFRAHNSLFFVRIQKYFAEELENYYRLTLEAKNPDVFSSTSLINEFDAWQEQFPEELWRLDYERKYKRTYVGGYGSEWDNAVNPAQINKAADTRFLADMMNGRKKYQRRQFERGQDTYMSSKFTGNTNFSDTITLRGPGDLTNSEYIYTPSGRITITPYSNMYINLYNATDARYYHERCYAGRTYTVDYPGQSLDFIYIKGASQIQSLGDLSLMYLQTATLGAGRRLKNITLGNKLEGYENKNLKNLDITSNNKLLEYLDIRNISTLGGDLPITNIPSLRKLYAQGTSYQSVTFANSGLLEEAYLPATINTLIANNLYFLQTLSVEGYDNLAKLSINNCPKIDAYDIVLNSSNLKTVRLTNVDWVLENTSLLNRLLKCTGIGEDGNTEIEQSVLTGRVHVPAIRAAEKEAYAAAWPELEVTYDREIAQFSIIFINGDSEIYRELKDQGTKLTDADNPVLNGTIPTPTIPPSEDGQFEYEFSSWKTSDGVSFNDITINSSDIVFYAQYSSKVREYTVTWMSDTGVTAKVLETKQVPWGNNAVYTKEIPTKAVSVNDYYLFNGWDKTSSHITKDTTLYPVWVSSNPYDLEGKGSEELSAIDLYGLKQAGTLNSFFNTDGDKLKMQLGYMPTYNDVEEVELVTSTLTFDGSNYHDTGITLFDTDKSFVLAIDFEMGASTTGTLAACYARTTNGFAIKGAGTGLPTLYYKSDSTKTTVGHISPTEDRTHREICVIRKIKGDNNLYVYTNNRFSFDDVKLTKLFVTDTFASTSNTLCFGAMMLKEGGSTDYTDNGIGKVHYSKLWYGDLGDEECRKICSWIYDEQEFEFVGAKRYYYAGSSKTTQASFVGVTLLDEPMYFNLDENDDTKRWKAYNEAGLRDWLQNKVFLGTSLLWQQTISKVSINALNGKPGLYGTFDGSLGETTNYFYLPSAAELDADKLSDTNYASEILTGQRNYGVFTNASSRLKRLGHSDIISSYWSRSPYKSSAEYMLGVIPTDIRNTSNGTVSKAAGSLYHYYTPANSSNAYFNINYEGTGTEQITNIHPQFVHGVLLCFSL